MSTQPAHIADDVKETPMEMEKAGVEDFHRDGESHVSRAVAAGIAANVEDFYGLVTEANEANDAERVMGVIKALKTYPKAIAWSFVLSSAIIMEGYDTAVVGSFWAYPPFLKIFGEPGIDGKLTIPARWQNGITASVSVGEIIGLQFAGWAAGRYGYRWTIIIALIAMIGFIFIPFFATSLSVFLAGEFLQGLSWGVFQTMTISYAAEVCPLPIRHWVTSYVNLCWFLGGFVSAGVLKGLLDRSDVWGYRIPFALQWIWPVPIMLGTFLAPESPWYYVKRGEKDQAEKSIKRLSRRGELDQRAIDRQLALMIYTDEMEKQISIGSSYLDCFKGVERRRTEIACMCWVVQTLCGSSLGGLQSYFYTSAGISTSSAYSLSWGQTAIGVAGTICSWFIVDRVGRRPLFIGAMIAIFCFLLVVGGVGIPETPSTAEGWTAGTFVLLISTAYAFSIGPVVYNLVGEIPSTRLRAKSVVLARNAYNVANVSFVSIVTYRQLDKNSWNWGSKAGFFWAGTNLLCTIYLYFRLPETKGRTYADLDILFENKVPARKFASTKIESLIAGTEEAA